ncbi:acyl carrier protein [Nocardioides jishulii]|uniref:Acyl carrier protein n=1 Tax=Nocardioides jishulii TaxID=2575440 RepID=A0A4V6X638_9ACTN|nr:acyl carrier protein [Nocardioides jishulii]QCX28870.1 acyl carrier protein [Nocardioides jishulii]TKI64233.1 acyl carrier protein [Nocardioides jishulii]
MAETPTPTTAAGITRESVLADLERILLEVVGDDLLMDGPLEMETSFSDDLQLESIEFVALAEELLNTYGEKVDFVAWMSGMELDQVVSLTAGEVVDFVVASLGADAPATGQAEA